MKIKFKKKKQMVFKPIRLKYIGGSHKHPIVKPRSIIPRSTSLFAPLSFNKPVKSYWGDYDKDGVINGLDCQPRNKFKQGAGHERRKSNNKKNQLEHKKKQSTAAVSRFLEEFNKEEHDEIEERARKRMTAKQRKAYFADDNDDNNTEPTNKQISEAMEAEDRYGELYREEQSKRCDMCGSKGKKLKSDRINPKLYKVCSDCVDADERGEETQPMDWAR